MLDRLLGYLPSGADTGHVLEIGGGTGALTDRLLRLDRSTGSGESEAERADDGSKDGREHQPSRVTTIELDPSLAAFLREEFRDAIEDGRLTVVEGDAVEVDLPSFTASVSNLPYGASSELLFRLLSQRRPAVVTVQAEFAKRLVAAPGTESYGRLSVTAGHYADARIVERVPASAFRPQPAVESAVVALSPRTPDYQAPEGAFFDLVRALFTQRRKTVRNAIRNTTHISGIEAPDAVVEAVDEEWLRARPGDLSPAAFAEMASLAAEHGARRNLQGGDAGG